MSTAAAARAELRKLGNADDAQFLQRFFKTGPGQYGEGDVFLGVRVPATRKVATQFRELSLTEIKKLLRAREHEARLLAVIILTEQYQRGDTPTRNRIFDLYLANTKYINNWDIVDSSAAQIVGMHLWQGSTKLLDQLAESESLWERRIAIIATHYSIKRDKYDPTLRIAKKLLEDEEDLIHKAVGWMLREVANRDQTAAEKFLAQHHKTMPRTMLRYAIEKFSPTLRAYYMAK